MNWKESRDKLKSGREKGLNVLEKNSKINMVRKGKNKAEKEESLKTTYNKGTFL